MNLVLRLLGGLLMAVLALAVWRARTEAGLVAASRIQAYDLSAPVRFALEPGAPDMKIVSWLVAPDEGPVDPLAQVPYALTTRILDPAGVPLRTDQLWTSSRSLRWEDPDGRVQNRQWLVDGTGRVLAARVTRLDLGPVAETGGTLELSVGPAAEYSRLLATVYRAGSRGEASQLRLVYGDSDAHRDQVTAEVGAPDWHSLPASWRARAVASTWQRLGALPDGAGVVPTTRLEARVDTAPEAPLGLFVPPGGAAAVTVTTAGSFGAEWTTPDGAATNTHAVLRVLGADGTLSERAVSGSSLGPLPLDGAACVTLTLDDTDGPRWLRTWLGDGARPWGEARRRQDRERLWVEPDLRTLDVWRASAGAPVRFRAQPGEVYRLSVRPRLSPEVATAPVGLRLRAVDTTGAVISEWPILAAAEPAPFERYVQGDNVLTASVAEPTVVEVRPPEGTSLLVVDADTPVEVALDTAAGTTAEPDPAYLPDPLPAAHPRFVPRLRAEWRARAPEDVEALATAGRAVRITGQVRFEPASGEPDEGAGPVDTLRSLHIPRPFAVLAEAAEAGQRATHTRIGAGASAALEVPPTGRLAVEYRVDPEAVGSTVTFRIDDRAIPARLLASAGELLLDGLSPGPAVVVADLPGLLLARAAGAPAWRTWRAWRLAEGEELEIPVPPGRGLFAVDAWLPAAVPAQLVWGITPKARYAPGIYEETTLPSGRSPLVPEAHPTLPLSYAGAPLTPTESVRIHIGDDLPGGTLRMSVAGSAVWIRLRATWATVEGAPPTRWWAGGRR